MNWIAQQNLGMAACNMDWMETATTMFYLTKGRFVNDRFIAALVNKAAAPMDITPAWNPRRD